MPPKRDDSKELLYLRQRIVDLTSRLTITLGIGRETTEDRSKLQLFLAHTAKVDDIFAEYSDSQKALSRLLIQLDEIEGYEDDQAKAIAFEKVYYEIKALEMELSFKDPPKTPPSLMDISMEKPPGLAPNYLPRIELKTFDGDPSEFPEFIDTFNSLVHRNNNISDLHKFHLLKNSLGPKALSTISSISVLEANYGLAYETINKRFFNQRLIAEEYIGNLLKVKPITDPRSLQQIQDFISQFCGSVNALSKLRIPDRFEFLLFVLASRNLDASLRQKFEESMKQETFPTFASLYRFLEETSKTLEIVKGSKCVERKASYSYSTRNRASNKVLLSSTTTDTLEEICRCCNESGHRIYTCKKFSEMPSEERFALVRQVSLCFNCLSGGHRRELCRSRKQCSHCGSSHHSLLCRRQAPSRSFKGPSTNASLHPSSPLKSSIVGASTSQPPKEPVSLSAAAPSTLSKTVLLGTAIVGLRGSDGKWRNVRCVLDSGSQLNFISSDCRKSLGIPQPEIVSCVSALSGTAVTTEGDVSILLRTSHFPRRYKKLTATVLRNITGPLPSEPIDLAPLQSVLSFQLADRNFHKSGKIDLLLGSEVFANVLKSGRYSLGKDLPVLFETELGWIIQGQATSIQKSSVTTPPQTSLISCCHLNDDLKRLWALEEVPNYNKPAHPLLDHFVQTYSREQDGRYVLRLPFRSDPSSLGESYNLAYRRFMSLERKFAIHSDFKRLYTNFMEEYIKLGHMSLLPKSVQPQYIIPHHGVVKKQVNKLRVVFDASMPTTTGCSLNDILDEGPKTQTDITDILLRFRTFKYVFTADICHMFRQILIHPNDRVFQCILWRDKPTEPLSLYQLNTVVYGLASSPFQAIRTLRQLALDEGGSFPRASQLLMKQTFVDDILGGADTYQDLTELISELQKLLNLGGFELRKWTTNCPSALDQIPKDHQETPLEKSSANELIFKILGLKWNQNLDFFQIDVSISSMIVTKRNVLRQLNSIYDPLGFVNPVIFIGKCLLRDLWLTGVDWDDEAPENVAFNWLKLTKEIYLLGKITIPRSLNLDLNNSLELHVFSDASEQGYGACIYARILSQKGFSVSLLMARSRIAPLKRLTLPKLELSAAHIGAKLMFYVATLLENNGTHISQKYAWTDSMIALSWIRTAPQSLQTFVANRVVEIQDKVSPDRWFHIPGTQNPADILSRGMLPSEILDSSLWWSGPAFLALSIEEWPPQPESPKASIPNVIHRPACLISAAEESWFSLYARLFSQLGKMVRVTAYLLRFKKPCHVRKQLTPVSEVPSISVNEWNSALHSILKLVQKEEFREEFERIKRKKALSVKFQRLSAFLDTDGLLKVGGRLRHSSLQRKHPVILPKKHWVTCLLIEWYHRINLHAGPQIVHALLLERYWILSARSIIRYRIFRCVHCFRSKPKPAAPIMGDLPKFRVTPARPFSRVGCDFAGPFSIKSSSQRKSPTVKGYICVFICLSTKAFHLEAVTALSTSAYISALSRLIARRGRPSDIFSDMGGGFVGGARVLKTLLRKTLLEGRKEIDTYSVPKGITFHFNPPHAPFCGGIWESAVKLTKSILLKSVGDQNLTYEEFSTLLAQVEAIANSRPILPLTAEPDNYEVLTPGHFLIGAPLVSTPEPDLTNEKTSLLRHWSLVQQMHQHFWRRWQKEYLHTLQQRTKWYKPEKNLVPGQLVLLKEENTPPLQWARGRILRVFPGQDTVTRVAEIKTPTGVFTRHCRKLCPLPIEEDS